MTTALSFMALGFFLGMRHATDADHVIAVGTIVTRQPTLRGGLLVGAVWGLGHTLTVVVVGGAIVLFRVVIPPALGLTMEMTVAVMLVALGAWNLTSAVGHLRQRAGDDDAVYHAHPHRHGDYVHSHAHGHAADTHGHREDATPQAWLDRHFGRLGPYQVLRPLVVGMVHGLAGSAAVALLVLATIGDGRWALAYLLLFGAGTVIGMLLITATIAGPVAYAARRSARLQRDLRLASGMLTAGVGLVLVYQIGFGQGLFTGRPSWSPH